MSHPDPISTHEARVLAVLAPGGMLTDAQLARDAKLTARQTAEAAARMSLRGLIGRRPARHGEVWEMTPRGRGWAATSIGRATIDVPGFKVPG